MSIDKLASIEAERSLIVHSFEDIRDFIKSSELIQPDYIYNQNFRTMYLAMSQIYKEKDKCEYADLIELLKNKNGDLDACSIVDFLSDISAKSHNVTNDSKIIREYAFKRKFHQVTREATHQIEKGKDLFELCTWIEKEIIGFHDSIKPKRENELFALIREIHKDVELYKTGKMELIPVLDFQLQEYIPGYLKGAQIMIGGYTSAGKSTYLMQLVLDMCKESASVLVFSTEDSSKEKTAKMISIESGIHQREIIMGEIKEDDLKTFVDASAHVNNYDVKIFDDVFDLEEMRLIIKKEKMQRDIDIVCLDYIQNIKREGTLYEDMSRSIRDLYQIGRDLNVCVIVLSQISNESARSGGPVIGLKGAGELASVPDAVLWIEKDDPNDEDLKRNVLVKVRKNRKFGNVGIIKKRFNESWTKLVPYSYENQSQS